jgi:dipeptidyl aminopeptidase/acylaminoacyl peptidase
VRRHWGTSDGQPRQWVSVQKRHTDWFAAVRHVRDKLAGVVDASRVSLWGTSLGGGDAIHVASRLPGQLRAVISQVGVYYAAW